MDYKEHRYNFFKKYFKHYKDTNLDLKMRILPLTLFSHQYTIEWTDFYKKKILLLAELAVDDKVKYDLNGLIAYHYKKVTYNGIEYEHLQLDCYNTADEIDSFIAIFYKYFDLKYNHPEFIDYIKTKTFNYRAGEA